MRFGLINLHSHSDYSAQDGLASVKEIVSKTAEFGLPSVAITDHGHMNNFGTFYLESKKQKIKPIFGCEFYYVPDMEESIREREEIAAIKNKKEREERRKGTKNYYHLIVLAKTKIGFYNINRLLHESYREKNMYYKNRIDFKMLQKYKKGLIVATACIGGYVPQMILKDRYDEAKAEALRFKRTFGKDFYIEIQYNEMKDQKIANKGLSRIAKVLKIPEIVTLDSHYANAKDYQTHRALLYLQSKTTFEEVKKGTKKAWEFHTKKLYYKSIKDAWQEVRDNGYKISKETFKKQVDNVWGIYRKVEKYDLDTSVKLKDADPTVKNKDLEIAKICKKNLRLKKLSTKKEYVDRLKFELSVIKQKKFANYFLLVREIIEDARRKMLVGCGRGSGAGSLVNYLLGITEIDPIKYGLYFERFLAIDRADYPDIDVDFENNAEIKSDLQKEHGDDFTCISLYTTFQLASLITDLARVYSIESPSEIAKINKKIAAELNNNAEEGEDVTSFEIAYKTSPTFKAFVNKHSELKRDLICLIGKIRHVGRHAAGVLISENMIKNQPLIKTKDGDYQTPLTEGLKERSLPEFGYVKIDILGLKTLQIIHDTCRLVKKRKTLLKKIHPDNINTSDQKVYKRIFKTLLTNGIFQLESDGIKSLIKKTKPDCFEDLFAINALYRPGPLQGGIAYEYGDRKRNSKEVRYENRIMRKILEPTYGIIIYQEQIMEIGHFLGNLTLAETNSLRKLLVKSKTMDSKQKKQFKALHKKYMIGAKRNKTSSAVAQGIWDQCEKFSGYGFNKSHSVSYAMIAFQCAWLKTYYPVQFYTALFNTENATKYESIISEVKLFGGIKINGIDINKSEVKFTCSKDSIYWGFSNINGIGNVAAEEIVKERDINGDFESPWDFLCREMNWGKVNKNVVNTIFSLGCFPKYKRKLLLKTYELFMIEKSKSKVKKADKKRKMEILKDCFEQAKKEIPKKERVDPSETKFVLEMQYYKTGVTCSPFSINGRGKKIKWLADNGKIGLTFAERRTFSLARFTAVRAIKDKRKRDMAFVDMVDYSGNKVPGIIFSSSYKKSNPPVQNGVYIVKLQSDGDSNFINDYKNLDSLKKN
jgi:DNA polymerase-3 subunit alpha